MDLVINHTSDEHEWFQKSRDPKSLYRDYYIWQPPKIDKRGRRLPPNNWTGFFMDKAWEFDRQSGEYYLHLFDKKQPDLNFKNPKVIEEVKKILSFWLDKGAAGFRCDVINVIYKTSLDDGKKTLAVCGLEHFKSQKGNHAVLKELRRDVLTQYDCFTVGETTFATLEEARLFSNEDRKELDMVFYFEHLEVDRRIAQLMPKKFYAGKLLDVIAKWQRGLDWNAVCLENHDQPRIVSHFGAAEKDSKYLARSAKMLGLFQLTLRGTLFIYQGQEIGMTNFDFKKMEELDDVVSHGLEKLFKKYLIPKFLRWKWIKASSRDNARTPMQWDDSKNAGFTSGFPWLGINSNYKQINYASQESDPGSVLNFYKTLISLRKENECLIYGEFIPVYSDNRIIVYQRKVSAIKTADTNAIDDIKTSSISQLNEEAYSIGLNFSSRVVKLPKKVQEVLNGKVILSNCRREKPDNILHPWEGVLILTSAANGK